MQLELERIQTVCKDAVLVKALKTPDKKGGLYVPESHRKVLDNRRNGTWKGEVVKMGVEVDHDLWKPEMVGVGDTVIIAPVAIDCPSFDQEINGQRETFIFIRAEDIMGKVV